MTKVVVDASTGAVTEVPLSAADIAQRTIDIAAAQAKATAEIPGLIKAEARRRIVALYPDWKQTNMVARGVELQDIWRLNGEWTVQETAEAAALNAIWAWIKTVREASDDLELDPPSDFTDNAYWPSNP